jgi:hypothetical protein
MKTGRLLKFHRPGADVHAYLYLEAGGVRAVLYQFTPGRDDERGPAHEISGGTTEEVEAEVRAWIDAHHPRAR